jgi:hypothetical protein
MLVRLFFIFIFEVVRGFLGRCEYKRRLSRARQEAMRVQHLLESVQYLSVDLSNHQQIALLNDQHIPKGKFFDIMSVRLH